MPPWLIPPHSVQKPYMNSPPSSIVTMFVDMCLLTRVFLNDVHGGVDIVIRLPERGYGVHFVEAHLLQCGDIP